MRPPEKTSTSVNAYTPKRTHTLASHKGERCTTLNKHTELHQNDVAVDRLATISLPLSLPRVRNLDCRVATANNNNRRNRQRSEPEVTPVATAFPHKSSL